MIWPPKSRKEKRSCSGCGKEIEVVIWARPDGSEIPPDTICSECRRKKREEEVVKRKKQQLEEAKESQLDVWCEQLGVPGIFIEKSFGKFKRELQPDAFDAVKGWKDTSLVLLSPSVYGIGKTHLVCALANHLFENTEAASLNIHGGIRKHHCPVHFTTEQKLINSIRQTFNRKDEDGKTDEDVFLALDGFPLLIIDDVGKVRPRDYSFLQGVYFRIIDDRYVNNQYIILTTNLDFKELEEHIGGASADRLREMCVKKGFIKMVGKSYRR